MQRCKQERIEAFKEMMYRNDANDRVKDIDKFSQWVVKCGYFDAPASANHHGKNTGDLFEHSYKVAEILLDYTDKLELMWQDPASPIIIGLFHDLCKMDQYTFINSTDDSEFVPDRGCKWKYREDQILKGHGDKSIMLLSQFMTLTEEEILCIRYHMGAYNCDDWKQFDLAIHKYPNVLYTHTADMLASKVYNI